LSASQKRKSDVLVIGGGLAGITAAAELQDAGFAIRVLEGRDRLGGRVHTLRRPELPLPVELGAEFIHGLPPEVFNVIQEALLPFSEVGGENRCLVEGQLEVCNDFWEYWESISKRMRLQHRHDESFAAFLERLPYAHANSTARHNSIEYVQGFNAANASRISLRSLIQDRDAAELISGDRAFRVMGGYDHVVRRLALRIRSTAIQTSTIVKTIHWKRNHVEVDAFHITSGAKQRFKARTAVITLPLGILQTEGERASVSFSPAIPEKIDAARRLVMGPVVKVIICFREMLWAKGGVEKLSFLHARGQKIPVWWTTAPIMSPLLTGWAGGPPAEPLSGKPQRVVLQAALQSLAECFQMTPRALRSRIHWWTAADWVTDPFARGAYSYAPAGSLDARSALAKPVEDTLFFAGEATHTNGFSGTVHGAIATGYRSAKEVMSVLETQKA